MLEGKCMWEDLETVVKAAFSVWRVSFYFFLLVQVFYKVTFLKEKTSGIEVVKAEETKSSIDSKTPQNKAKQNKKAKNLSQCIPSKELIIST